MNKDVVTIKRKCSGCEKIERHPLQQIEMECRCGEELEITDIEIEGEKKEVIIELLEKAISRMDETKKGESGFRDALKTLKNGITKHWEYFQNKEE